MTNFTSKSQLHYAVFENFLIQLEQASCAHGENSHAAR